MSLRATMRWQTEREATGTRGAWSVRAFDAALAEARRDGAALAWLETSSANHPAITAARRLGFEICGFDTTLYRGTPRQGEVAVFMAHPIDGDARG